VHRIFDRPHPEGWDKQIGGSLGVMASAERRTARDSLSADLGRDVHFNTATYWRLAAGNIQTYAAAGMSIVIGKDLPLVSPPPPGIGNKLHGEAKLPGAASCMAPWLQCTAFGSVEGRFVAYNVFLDGRLLRDDPSVKKRNFVSDLVIGTRFDFPNTRTADHGPWFIQFKLTRRSPEFRSSIPVPRHRVAALTIGTEF
jgi:lipid A 3-O-deacylase